MYSAYSFFVTVKLGKLCIVCNANHSTLTIENLKENTGSQERKKKERKRSNLEHKFRIYFYLPYHKIL